MVQVINMYTTEKNRERAGIAMCRDGIFVCSIVRRVTEKEAVTPVSEVLYSPLQTLASVSKDGNLYYLFYNLVAMANSDLTLASVSKDGNL